AQRHRQLGAGVSRRLPRAPTAVAAGALAEQVLEEIGETAAGTTAGEDLVVVEIRLPALPAAEAAGRRADLVAGAVSAGAQLVVGRALLRVTQRFIGFVDRLELVLGALFLADVGMV